MVELSLKNALPPTHNQASIEDRMKGVALTEEDMDKLMFGEEFSDTLAGETTTGERFPVLMSRLASTWRTLCFCSDIMYTQ